LATEWEVPGEFTQIETGDSLVTVIGSLILYEVNKYSDQVKVILLVEEQEVLLPELFSVNRAPSKVGLDADFLSELVN
jgi:hypothetical protein